MSTQTDALWGIIEPWLAAERVELDDLELVGSGRARTLRILVDAENGIDLDRLSALSGGISALLDAESELDGPYQLEVSSPGLERKLTRPRHFQKSVGREVSVKVRREGTGSTIRGTVTEADDDAVTLKTDAEEVKVAYGDVTSAKTMFRWEAAPKPGKK
jgi:ribosome maturation factor RimP